MHQKIIFCHGVDDGLCRCISCHQARHLEIIHRCRLTLDKTWTDYLQPHSLGLQVEMERFGK